MKMEQELVTTQSIISWLRTQVEEKNVVAPSTFVDAALKLAVLMGEENDHLFELQQKVAQLRVDYINEGMSVTESKTRVEATDGYKLFHQQKARTEQILEFIRISKLRARTTSEEMRS